MGMMERIVVGGDHTRAATAALRWAALEAAETGAAVVVVHAFEHEPDADLFTLHHDRRAARYRTQSWVVEALGDLHAEVPVAVVTPDGPIEDALLSVAQNAKMVVLGQARHGRDKRLASELARTCHCPVITVAHDHATLVEA